MQYLKCMVSWAAHTHTHVRIYTSVIFMSKKSAMQGASPKNETETRMRAGGIPLLSRNYFLGIRGRIILQPHVVRAAVFVQSSHDVMLYNRNESSKRLFTYGS